MKVDLGGLMKHLEKGRNHASCPHLIVALMGRLKGETGERCHAMVMARDHGRSLGRPRSCPGELVKQSRQGSCAHERQSKASTKDSRF